MTCHRAGTGVTPSLIPRDVLFGNPVKSRVRLSPNGEFLAYCAPVDSVLNIWVKTIGHDDDRPITRDTSRGVRFYFWAEDSRHILYAQDIGGNENWRMYAVDLETDKIKDLTPFENIQVRTVATHKDFPHEILFSMNKENPRAHDMYHLDLTSGEMTLVAKNPGNIIDWIPDAQFRVCGAIAALPDGGFELMIRDSEETDWRALITWDAENSMTSAPNFLSPPTVFSKDGKYISFMDSRDVNAGRMVRMEIATGNIKVIAEDSQYDVSDNILIHSDNYEIQAIAFEKARCEWMVLDETIKDDFAAIAKLDRGDFSILGRDNTDNTWLVSFEKDNGPVTYYVYDRKTQNATYLFNQQPGLDKYTLATMEPISFTSRDGLTIHGYITFPPGREKKNLPMVLVVHGGPWARNSWGFDPKAQWLANRGYAVLQVNFRGSTGYGKAFVNAGDKEWGGKAQNDLIDAVNWALERGIADPKRVAIYGESYGGYAALAGATFTPDLFCCAVDVCGPSNLVSFIRALPPWYSTLLATIYERMGNPDTEEEFLKSRSPLFKVDQIKIPILIAQGANDPRVKQEEAEQIVAAMKEKGLEYEYLLFPDEGHGLVKPENRLTFYAAAERFFAKHMGGRYEKAPEKLNQ
ncbi:peptidase S9 [candidate division WOR_3 bacterium SM23_60]|uniref:Peptidase S9 n=1 Tax=candidate division WOR_3 bacterium SM23_60 TaxID=1703780 RepID=A0A0S8GF17_UNCW3|nr:MAG: peptidase S9 [candidate division WOR_3 bacterium SM23_60]